MIPSNYMDKRGKSGAHVVSAEARRAAAAPWAGARREGPGRPADRRRARGPRAAELVVRAAGQATSEGG